MPVYNNARQINTVTHKCCPKCHALKDRSEYYKNSKRRDKIDVYCKICSMQTKKEHLRTSEKAREKTRERRRKYVEKHPEKVLEISKTFREKHKEKIADRRKTEESKAYSREYMKKRRLEPIFKMKNNISRQIGHALKRRGSSKHGQTVLDKLNYSIEQLKEHLEKQFDFNMNWENYGTYWHIDHIIPHSGFSYVSMDDEDFKKCWSLDNLRPLEAIENIKKSNKILCDIENIITDVRKLLNDVKHNVCG